MLLGLHKGFCYMPHDYETGIGVNVGPDNLVKDRVAIRLRLEVSGVDLQGQDFVDQGWTTIIGRSGGAIVIDRFLAPEQTLTIKRAGAHQEAEVRIIGQIGRESDGNVYGVAFLDSRANIWGVAFPADDVDEALLKLVLECSACSTFQIVSLNALELEVFEAKGNLSRHCPKCRDTTLWKQSLRGIPPKPETAVPSPMTASTQPESVPGQKSAGAGKRRRRARVKVELKGSILFGGQETPVQVTDMSRGGVRLLSRRSFAEGLLVRVAVPYIPNAANIFVPARVRWCRLLPSGMTDYGLEYVKD